MKTLILAAAIFSAGSLHAQSAPPTCKGQAACAAMWIDAQEHIQAVTRMRLRLVTNDRLETFASRGPFYMVGTVVKYPIADDEFEMRATIECRNASTCADLPAMGVGIFNRELANGAAMREMTAARK